MRSRGRATAYPAALAAAVAALAAAALPAAAHAAGGTAGTAGSDSAATASAPALGVTPFGVPRIRAAVLRGVRCLAGCADAHTPRTDARLRVRGRTLRGTEVVVFLGAAGDADDVATRPLRRTRTAVDVRVPLGAASGPVTVADRNGARASAPIELTIASGHASAPRTLVAGGPQVEAQVGSPRGFFDAAVPPHVTYVLHAADPAPVTVEVVRDADGAVVASWAAGTVAPERVHTTSWDGTADGRLAPAGRYSFRVGARMPGAPRAVTSEAADPIAGTADDPATFVLLRHVFPVRGPHYFGEGPARFGGGRGHQGQDVFATCGTPILAARGGVVKARGFQAAAGNYLVIDGARTGVDYGYMHLRSTALVAEGERVRTGQLVGYVGDTGDASACHLHQELWTAPGWYDGGAPYDPLPSLQAWDRTT